MSKMSRNKGARVERALRDDLIRHGWSDASREGWKQVRGGAIDSGDVVAKTPSGNEKWFECKARAKAFQRVYALMNKHRVFDRGTLSWSLPSGRCVIVAYNPTELTKLASEYSFPGVDLFQDKEDKRVMRQIAAFKETHLMKKNKEGKLVDIQADYLAIKGDREPFAYIRILG